MVRLRKFSGLTNVSEEFSGSRGGQVQASSVQVGILLAQHFCILHFEYFIESELEKSLEGDNNVIDYSRSDSL